MRSWIVVLMTALPFLAVAQQPEPDKAGKREPASRLLDLQQRQQQDASLPAIDLPEFVITGSASIDPPDARKYPYDEQGSYVRSISENTAGMRERETIDLGQRFKQSLLVPSKRVVGTLHAGLGNFFTPEVAASVGLTDPSFDLAGTVSYWRTKGFTRHADASRGMVAVQGSHELVTGSDVIQQARLSGAASFKVDSYKFYGSLLPSTQRDINQFDLRIQSWADLGTATSLRAGLALRGMNIRDGSTTTTENGFRVDVGGFVPIFEFPVNVQGRAWFATVTTAAASKLSLITLALGTPRLTWGRFSMRAGAEAHGLEGMNGQKGSYFFPYAFLDFRLTNQHGVFLSFQPAPVFETLENHLGRNPYLSASAVIRHTIARLAVRGGLESEWNDWLSTGMWLEFKSMTDYPFYADSTAKGTWLLAYGGKTNVTTFHVNAVANLSSYDYFAFQSVVRLSKSTVVAHVPYIPEFEASATWTHRFGHEIDVSPRAGIISSQYADVAGLLRLGGYVWTGVNIEYLGLGDLKFFLDVTNLANQKYEVWKGYRAEPFRVSAGLTYRW